MKLEKRSRLIMIGDSITDCDRVYDAPPAGWGSFGNGYVQLVNSILTGLSPESEIMVINKGISGNTILDFKKRWEKDVIEMKPDYVSIMIGINDVWRHFDASLQQLELVDEQTFAETYEKLIVKTKPLVKDIFILSSFMIEPNKEDAMRKMTDCYNAIAKNIAQKHGLIFIDVQKQMDVFLESLSSYALCNDRVHPSLSGHMIIAKAFLDGIGFSWTK